MAFHTRHLTLAPEESRLAYVADDSVMLHITTCGGGVCLSGSETDLMHNFYILQAHA